jgi:hypothetical protein
MGLIKNKGALFAAIDKDVKRNTFWYGRFIKSVVEEVHLSLLEKTPVHTGQTIRNYVWTEGTPFSGVLDAIGSGIEPTNEMPLGPEAHRAANAADSTATMNALDFTNPFKNYIVTNNSPAIKGLEMGNFPLNTPTHTYNQRSPNGMFLITEKAVSSKIKSGILK